MIDISETMAVSCDGKHTAQIASHTALTLVIGNLEEGTKKQVSFKKEEEKEACPPDNDDAFFLGFTEPKIVSYTFTDDNQYLEVTVQNITSLLTWHYVLSTGQKILKDKITLPYENCTFVWKSSASPAIFLHKKELLKQESELFFGTTPVAFPHTTKELLFAFNNNHSLMLVYSDVKKQIVVLDTQTGDALKTIDCSGMIQALTFGPDATTGAAVVRTNTNCAITIFDITTGAHVSNFDITDSLKRCHKKPKSTMNLALTNKHAILSLGLSKHDRTTIVYDRASGIQLKGISHPMTNILPDGSLITLDQATNCFGDMNLSISYTLDATQEALKDLNDCSLHDLCVIAKIIQYPCNQLTADDQAVFDNLPESLKKLR